MSEQVYEVPPEWKKRAHVDDAKYAAMYERSIKDPDGFWAEEARHVDWFKPFTKVKNTSFDPHNVSIRWFEDGVTNVAHNCLDRHLATRGDQTAIIWEGDDPAHDRKITYRELHAEVSPLRQCAQGPRRQEGRSRHHLSADDSASRGGDAGLRPHRRHPFGGVRRVFARFARRPHRGCRLHDRHHGG